MDDFVFYLADGELPIDIPTEFPVDIPTESPIDIPDIPIDLPVSTTGFPVFDYYEHQTELNTDTISLGFTFAFFGGLVVWFSIYGIVLMLDFFKDMSQ